MADEDDELESEEESSSGGSKGKLIIMVEAGLLLMATIIGATLYFLGLFGGDDEIEDGAGIPEEVVEVQAAAMYYPIKPSFIVNFQSRGRQRYLQVDVNIMTRGSKVFDAIQAHLPLIKNQLVMLFSGENYENLQTDEGRELLRQKAQHEVQAIVEQETGLAGVEQILFTNFVMQ